MTPAVTRHSRASSVLRSDPPSAGDRRLGTGSLVLLQTAVTSDGSDPVPVVPPSSAGTPGGVPDAELAEQVRAGDHRAFRLLFERYADRLVDFAIGFVQTRETAQDVVADVFFAVWQGHVGWIPERVSTYLFAAVRNRCHNYRTRAHVRHEIELSEFIGDESSVEIDPAPSASDLLDEAELYARVVQVLETLPPQRKAAAILRWREGLGFDEIAHTLRVSENAARLHVSRALKAVRAALGVSPG